MTDITEEKLLEMGYRLLQNGLKDKLFIFFDREAISFNQNISEFTLENLLYIEKRYKPFKILNESEA